MAQSEERIRILKLVESGQVSAEEGARLLASLGDGSSPTRTLPGNPARSLRVRVTDLATHRQKVNVTIPAGLINVGRKLGARLTPGNSSAALEEILRAVEQGVTGRIYEMQDLEEGERVEIFVE